jgi:hypothetical protein
MADGEVDCDKDWRGNKYYDTGHQEDLRAQGKRARAWTVWWPLNEGRGEERGFDRSGTARGQHSELTAWP